MALFAETKELLLRSFLALANGLPSHAIFTRLFRNLDPDQFRDSFQRFMAQFSGQLQGVAAIDGKTGAPSDRSSPLGWRLLGMLTLKGTVITADALNCHRAIAGQIVEQKGDYALALKGNQGTLFDDVVLLFDDPELKASTAATVVESDHGRIETRTATVSTEFDWLEKQHQWPGLKVIGKVVRVRVPHPCSHGTGTYFTARGGTKFKSFPPEMRSISRGIDELRQLLGIFLGQQ